MIRTLQEVVLPEVRCPSIITRCPGLTGRRGRSNGRQRGGSTVTIMAETPKVRVTVNELLNFGRYYYRLPKKLREGNVLGCVCLSVILSTGGSQHRSVQHRLPTFCVLRENWKATFMYDYQKTTNLTEL